MTRILAVLLLLTVPSLAATVPINQWEPEEKVMVGSGCKDEDAVMLIAEAAEESELYLRQVFVITRSMGLCGFFEPREAILKKRLKVFVDFEKDTVEIWLVEIIGVDEPFWTWIVAKGKKS